jgi:hypothetical protein
LLQDSAVESVIIDTELGLNNLPARELAGAAAASAMAPQRGMPLVPPRPAANKFAAARVATAREFGTARKIAERHSKLVSRVFLEARLGRGITARTVDPLIDDIYASVQRNLYAFNGLLRCREFMMKDAYSFDVSEERAFASYAAMREAFASGTDIHTRTAAAVFGVDAGAVNSEMRRAAKAVNFGILYGQSAFGLAKALSIPQAEAAEFIAAYLRTFAGAAEFMDDLLDRCRRDGHVTTMLGRRRTIAGVRDRPGRRNAAGVLALALPERTAINTVVQGSAADLIKLAMLRVSRQLAAEKLTAALVLQIHDELVLECPAAETPAVRRLVLDEMRSALPLEVPLEVSVHEGETWAECEK